MANVLICWGATRKLDCHTVILSQTKLPRSAKETLQQQSSQSMAEAEPASLETIAQFTLLLMVVTVSKLPMTCPSPLVTSRW